MLYMALIGAVVMGGIAPFYWKAPDASGWCLLIALGVVGSLGHWLLIRALLCAPASSLQPFHYTVLIWAAMLGILVYDNVPDLPTILGAAIIAASGIYAGFVEHRERQEASTA